MSVCIFSCTSAALYVTMSVGRSVCLSVGLSVGRYTKFDLDQINIVGNPEKLHLAWQCYNIKDGVPTDRPTDRPTDLPTDIVTYRAAEVQLKTKLIHICSESD